MADAATPADFILVIDCGSQLTQLIARRVRGDAGTFCEILSADECVSPQSLHAWLESRAVAWGGSYISTIADSGARFALKGVIIGGGPASAAPLCSNVSKSSTMKPENVPPTVDPSAIDSLGVPVLGICYGFQITAALRGGLVIPAIGHREFGRTLLTLADSASASLDTQKGMVFFKGVVEAQKLALEKEEQEQEENKSKRSSVAAAGVGDEDEDRDDSRFKSTASVGPIVVWMSHGDQVDGWPGQDVIVLAKSTTCHNAAVYVPGLNFWGVQFHPEVAHTPGGDVMLRNFVLDICGCRGGWSTNSGQFVQSAIERVRETVGNDHVLLGLSGGVDSAVVAALLYQAIGPQLWCVFVDNGLLREGEAESVQRLFKQHLPKAHFIFADEGKRFIKMLDGVADPERKRKIIGNEFVEVFLEHSLRIQDAAVAEGSVRMIKFLAQGTLYPDVIESQPVRGARSSVIKTHHNVGGLPEKLRLQLIEPLRELFKDEVRALGTFLGLPEEIVWRQPFPGPGLAIRILGQVTEAKLATLRRADAIMREEMDRAGLTRVVWQALVVLTPVHTVGVMGDARTYGPDNVVAAVRAVISKDGMTADWFRWPYPVIDRISTRIVNEVAGISRVVMDVTSKPPGTIEWE